MTKAEAITIIKKEYLCVNRNCDIERSCGKCDLVMPDKEPILEAYKMAIKALEQEPCEDAVSRQAVIDTLDRMDKVLDEDRTVENYKELLKECYEVLPPVNPQKIGHWIDDEFGSKCSCCNIYTHLDKFDRPMLFRYCSMCGAKMIEPQESEVQE